MHNKFSLLIVLSIFMMDMTFGQHPWVAYPTANNSDYGVFHFRKSFTLDQRPDELVLHISADNRYKLYVNGQKVCYGPAKGDLQTYKYDVIDVAEFLKEGENVFAAIVFNEGKDMAMSLFSNQTSFMLESENEAYSFLNSDQNWKTYQNTAYSPVTYQQMLWDEPWFRGYYACGPGDRVKSDIYPWGWQNLNFNDNDWEDAETLVFQKEPWPLVPRNIPFMADHEVHPETVRRAGDLTITNFFDEGKSPMVIPAHSKVEIIIDFGHLTMGYPQLTVEGGAGSTIKMSFAEALYQEFNLKAHRDSVGNYTMEGVYDVYITDGPERTFEPLWKRTARYVALTVETQNGPLQLKDLYFEYSGYPYENMATFKSSNDTLNTIFEMCQRTLAMCSGETYYDTPFYEQLSYGGDNLPISHISLYSTTDDQLLREMLRIYPQSVNSETGLMKSAYPSRFDFDMGGWSMAWAQTLDDYFRMKGDSAFVRQFVPAINGILDYYKRHTNENLQVLGTINTQNFLDWSITTSSIPRRNEAGDIENSLMLTAFYILTLEKMSDLYGDLGLEERSLEMNAEAEYLKAGMMQHGWNPELGLFRDHVGQEIYSQHTNILAILADIVPEEDQRALLYKVLHSKVFDEYASSFWTYFVFNAMEKLGEEDLIVNHLGFWKDFINRGFTTTGETGFASHDRSDCHAWSAHPAYYFLHSIAGIKHVGIGFKEILIEPHLGDLKSLATTMPLEQGTLSINYQIEGSMVMAKIEVPNGLKANFKSGERKISLNPGMNEFTFKQ